MVVIAGEVFDGDLRVGEGGFDEGFDFAGWHGHDVGS
jgi:hypothetical protein